MMQSKVIDEEEARLHTLARLRHLWTGKPGRPSGYPRQTGIGLSSLCPSGMTLFATDGQGKVWCCAWSSV